MKEGFLKGDARLVSVFVCGPMLLYIPANMLEKPLS